MNELRLLWISTLVAATVRIASFARLVHRPTPTARKPMRIVASDLLPSTSGSWLMEVFVRVGDTGIEPVASTVSTPTHAVEYGWHMLLECSDQV